MRKKFFLFAAMMTAAVFNANAQVQTSEGGGASQKFTDWQLYCQWDSTYNFTEDSAYEDKQIVHELDTVNRTVLVYEYEWEDSQWKPDEAYKYFFDNQGRMSLKLKDTYVVSFDNLYFSDSTVYIYGNQEMTEIHYENPGGTYNSYDSTIYKYDAKGNLIEKIEYAAERHTLVYSPSERGVYIYDAATNLQLTDSTFKYDKSVSDWDLSYVISNHIDDGKISETYYYYTSEKDTTMAFYYTYEGDTVQTRNVYMKSAGVWGKSAAMCVVATYNKVNGQQQTYDIYAIGGSSWKYQSGVHVYYTVPELPSAIEDVVADPKAQAVKFIQNGKLYIRQGEAIYDARGAKRQ